MHIGMSDLSVFRFAKSPRSGWTTAAGMYVGHYMAWIAAALLYAAYIRTPEALHIMENGGVPPVAPGPLAYNAIGIFGILTVILAGWTTANPTIYRSGSAFQAILPKASTFWVTVVAGTVATIAGIFPAFAMKLLDFVAVYGFVLAPVGAIIVFEHFFADRFGVVRNWAEITGSSFNLSVLVAWAASGLLFYFISVTQGIFLSFLTLPAWLTCGLLYLLLSRKNPKICLNIKPMFGITDPARIVKHDRYPVAGIRRQCFAIGGCESGVVGIALQGKGWIGRCCRSKRIDDVDVQIECGAFEIPLFINPDIQLAGPAQSFLVEPGIVQYFTTNKHLVALGSLQIKRRIGHPALVAILDAKLPVASKLITAGK